MHRWVTNFINENQEKWENEIKLREEKAKEELKSWEKMKRLEKINKLKEKWRKDRTPGGKLAKESEKPTREETWEIWRKKSKTSGGGGGGGSFPEAFPIPLNKAPPEVSQAGDPPLGKERGTLGVGTGPPPPYTPNIPKNGLKNASRSPPRNKTP